MFLKFRFSMSMGDKQDACMPFYISVHGCLIQQREHLTGNKYFRMSKCLGEHISALTAPCCSDIKYKMVKNRSFCFSK
uniref:Uncharacterized protein n=1 Tax=Rhizophora mucronata TaxID=61149 RepID=A0A2P2LE02_RHIMU